MAFDTIYKISKIHKSHPDSANYIYYPFVSLILKFNFPVSGLHLPVFKIKNTFNKSMPFFQNLRTFVLISMKDFLIRLRAWNFCNHILK